MKGRKIKYIKITAMILVFFITTNNCLAVSAKGANASIKKEVNTKEEDEISLIHNFSIIELLIDKDKDGIPDCYEKEILNTSPNNPDTDGDGIPDGYEWLNLESNPLQRDADLDNDADGLTNLEEYQLGLDCNLKDSDNDEITDYDEVKKYDTNPHKMDTDGDGMIDSDEILLGLNPKEKDIDMNKSKAAEDTQSYSNKQTAEYVRNNGKEYELTFDFNFNWFLESNKKYNEQLAYLSSIMSGLAYYAPYNKNTAYDKIKIKDEKNSYKTFDLEGYLKYMGFSDIKRCYLGDKYEDNDLVQFNYSYKKIKTANKTKYLVPVIIRGTSDSKEWRSNFDIGKSGPHKGFNVTANRVVKEINSYLKQHKIDSDNAVIWVTGHSRGGAVANLSAKKLIDKKYKVFAYTFAAPSTAQSKNSSNSLYEGIYNIINKQDLVPKLPLRKWGFDLYGTKKESSLTKYKAAQFEGRIGESYKAYSDENMGELIKALEEIAETREDCFQYTCSCHSMTGKKTGKSITIASKDYESRKKAEEGLKEYKGMLTKEQIAACRFEIVQGEKGWRYTVCQTPMLLMLKMADAMGGPIGTAKFVFGDVGAKYERAKRKVITSNFYIGHPHYVDSYILLTRNH